MSDGSLVEIQNIAEDKVSTFEMDPVAALALIQSGEVTGTWHTHPGNDPALSGEDYSFFTAWPTLTHSIVGVRDGQPMTLTYRVQNGLVVCV